MDERGSALAINEEVARWVARIDSRPLDDAARLELEQWLARDQRHRGAMFRALAIWQILGEGNRVDQDIWDALEASSQSNDNHVAEDRDAAMADGPPWPDTRIGRRRMLWASGAIAAALAPFAFMPLLRNPRGTESSKRITTGLGETAEVPLRDGSLVVVNTTSDLEVDQSEHVRNVRLETGEAWFRVAKDTSRPFVVAAGDVRVRAVGTAFSVRRREDGASVQVTEGVVEVWTEGQATGRARVAAGARTFVSERIGAQAPVEDAAGIERTLLWREGALKFQGDTIRDAAAEFNRYNATKLEVDPTLADEKVVGRFSTKEPDVFANMISLAFGARIERQDGIIRIAQN